MTRAAILDIDGTLVDTNYHHAVAWYRAFRQHEVVLPVWRIHRHVGMGGDQLISALAGEDVERDRGDDIRTAEKALYMALIEEVEPLPGARELVAELKRRDRTVVLASSAKADEVDHYVDLLGVRDLADGWTTSKDVEATKPAPDLIAEALEEAGVGSDEAALVGDSVWDVKAANRAGVPTIGVLTGGFSAAELEDAGAAAVFESAQQLLERIDESAFGGG